MRFNEGIHRWFLFFNRWYEFQFIREMERMDICVAWLYARGYGLENHAMSFLANRKYGEVTGGVWKITGGCIA
jgi:hypothetical protein